MSENSQDTLVNSSQEDILSSKLENTKIDTEDADNPENPMGNVTNKVY
jgi:hypothetical protein